MNPVERLMANIFGTDFGAAKPAPNASTKPAKPASNAPAKVAAAKPTPQPAPKPAAAKPTPKPAPAKVQPVAATPAPAPKPAPKKDVPMATQIPAKVSPKGLYVLRKGLNPNNSPPEVVAAIKKLQDALGMKVPANEYGYFGGKTDEAVRAFQKRVGFTGKDIDGIVGDATWSKLPVAATPAGKAQATANAAVTAAAAAAKQAAQPKPKPAPVTQVIINQAAPKPAPSNPVVAAAQRAAQATQSAGKAATKAVSTATDAVKQTHVIIKKQPLWLQIVTFAAAGLGAVAGIAALTDKKKKPAQAA